MRKMKYVYYHLLSRLYKRQGKWQSEKFVRLINKRNMYK